MTTLFINFIVARSTTTIVIRCRHIEHNIVKLLVVVLLDVVVAICLVASIVVAVGAEFRVFSMNVNELVVSQWHVLLDEIVDSFT